MCIDLTTSCLSISNLSQMEKHILMVLCFISDKNHEAYRSISKLSKDCSCSIKSIERAFKNLRDKGYLEYTGKIAPKSKNIPIYRINLNHGQPVRDKSLTTDIQDSNHGQSVLLTTDSKSIWIDYKRKDNKKDNNNFFQFELQQINFYKKNPQFPITKEDEYLFK